MDLQFYPAGQPTLSLAFRPEPREGDGNKKPLTLEA
jgi:hypothetical protein